MVDLTWPPPKSITDLNVKDYLQKKTKQKTTQKNILEQTEMSQKGNKEHFTHQRKMSKLAYSEIKNPCLAKDANEDNKKGKS